MRKKPNEFCLCVKKQKKIGAIFWCTEARIYTHTRILGIRILWYDHILAMIYCTPTTATNYVVSEFCVNEAQQTGRLNDIVSAGCTQQEIVGDPRLSLQQTVIYLFEMKTWTRKVIGYSVETDITLHISFWAAWWTQHAVSTLGGWAQCWLTSTRRKKCRLQY